MGQDFPRGVLVYHRLGEPLTAIPSHFQARFSEACIECFCGAKLRIMQLIRKSDSLVKLNPRLAPEQLKAVDALCQTGGARDA